MFPLFRHLLLREATRSEAAIERSPAAQGSGTTKRSTAQEAKRSARKATKKGPVKAVFFFSSLSLSFSFCRCIVDFAIILKDSSGEETRGGFFGRPVADCNYQLLSNHKFHVASLIHTDQSCTEQRYCKVGSSEIRAAKGADGPMVLLYSSVDVNPVKVQMNAEERANRANMQ